MRVLSYVFTPPLHAWLLTLALLALFVRISIATYGGALYNKTG